eukprot:SAG22_NODE_10873_length_512_cov_1.118644_1_plen_43_part_10
MNELRVGLNELPGGWVARGQAFELWVLCLLTSPVWNLTIAYDC